MSRRAVVVGEGPAADAVTAALRGGIDPLDVVIAHHLATAAGAGAVLAVEATPDEPLPAKAAALAALLARMPANLPIAVATRHHTIASLLPTPRDGDRVVGLRVLPGTPVAELAMPAAFDDRVVDAVLDLLDGVGLVTLPCGDGPGRIVDRLVAAAALDSLGLQAAGLATPTSVAAAIARTGLSIAVIGTHELAAIASAMHDGLGAARFAMPAPDPLTARAPEVGLDADAIAGRLELVVIAEAYRLVGEAMAGADEIERAMTLGAGWATGPFTMAGRRGLRDVVTRLTELARAPGVDLVTADRFAMPPVLWQVATI